MKKSGAVIAIVIGIVLLSTILIIVGVILGSDRVIKRPESAIALITLSGSIAEGSTDPFFAAGITPTSVRRHLERAERDTEVGAIVLKIDSGGGAVGASQEIGELVRNTDKPVVVFAGDMVASGGYYIASQADRIVAKPGSIVGSIGVISQVMDLTGLYEMLGIEVETIKSGEHKDMFTRTMTPEEREKLQRLSDEIYEQFIDDVAAGRGLSTDTVRELATGELFPASIAQELDLIDELGGYQTAIDTAAQLADIEDPRVKEYRPPTFFEDLFSAPGFQIRSLIRMHVLGPEYALLEYINNNYTVPQYRHSGGG